jgi:hypothetical protein
MVIFLTFVSLYLPIKWSYLETDFSFKVPLQLISRNFGHANCEVGWEFGNYKHEIIKLIGNRPIKFGFQ